MQLDVPTESSLIFEGPGPFHMPGCAQSVHAEDDLNNGVTLTVNILIPGRAGEPEAVSVQMSSDLAVTLSGLLAKAAAKAGFKLGLVLS